MKSQYIIIMIQSLQKKIVVLDQIDRINKEQAQILKCEMVDWNAFDKTGDEKLACIAQLEQLDEGFEQTFSRLKEDFSSESFRKSHKQEITQLQELIRVITQKSMSIQACESRNKQMVDQYFQHERESIGKQRTTSKRAMDYYQTMRQTNVTMPQFLDSKK